MTESSLTTLKQLYAQNTESFLADLKTFLSFPSISSESEYKPEVDRCVNWLKKYIETLGFECRLWPTSGHPVLFGSYDAAGPDKPTLLIYNHYDVQPVDPLEEWQTPPFEPTIRDGCIYARGAQDNKGQCFYVLQALKLLIQKDGKLPLNIKLCIEGEEECGSQGLSEILSQRKELLQADYLAVVDLGIKGPSEPSLTLGIRGLVTMDIELIAANSDMHSGLHGGIAYNPIHALVEVLAKLRDSTGKVTLPGFYDNALALSPEEINQLSLDFDSEEYERTWQAKPVGGEAALSPLERNWLRPTLEINGISGGYSGTGFKTVIPAKASAKISCRLVPNQTPEEIGKCVADFIKQHTSSAMQVKVNVHPGGKPAGAKISSTAVKAFSEAYLEIFRKSPEFIYSGASIPIIPALATASGSEIVLVGLGLESDHIHAPNERFSLDRLEKGALIMARALELLSQK